MKTLKGKVMEDIEKLYTSGDVARICQVDQSTVFHWIKKERLIAFRTPGGHFRIQEPDFKDFLLSYKPQNRTKKAAKAKSVVLLIDDEPLVHQVLSKFFEKNKDLEFLSAMDAYQGLMLIGSRRPDVIILDIKMPGLSGVEVVDGICSNTVITCPEIVVLSGYLDEIALQKLADLGVEHIFEKTEKMAVIRDTVLGLRTREA